VNAHVEDLAELYALGLVETGERERIDAHIESCEACARALGRAEAAVLAMEEACSPASATARPPVGIAARRERPWLWGAIGAAAAAAVLAAGASWENRRLETALARNDLALGAITRSHIRHSSFVALTQDAPPAKALYAPDGAWLYVIIDRPHCACRVVVRTGTAERDLGEPQANRTTATLYVPRPGPIRSIALTRPDGTSVLATAQVRP
jgi:hypothetical protein